MALLSPSYIKFCSYPPQAAVGRLHRELQDLGEKNDQPLAEEADGYRTEADGCTPDYESLAKCAGDETTDVSLENKPVGNSRATPRLASRLPAHAAAKAFCAFRKAAQASQRQSFGWRRPGIWLGRWLGVK